VSAVQQPPPRQLANPAQLQPYGGSSLERRAVLVRRGLRPVEVPAGEGQAAISQAQARLAMPSDYRSAWERLLSVECAKHEAPPGQPCWSMPEAVCGSRISEAHRAPTPVSPHRIRRKTKLAELARND
jgi:hypothetical protein